MKYKNTKMKVSNFSLKYEIYWFVKYPLKIFSKSVWFQKNINIHSNWLYIYIYIYKYNIYYSCGLYKSNIK